MNNALPVFGALAGAFVAVSGPIYLAALTVLHGDPAQETEAQKAVREKRGRKIRKSAHVFVCCGVLIFLVGLMVNEFGGSDAVKADAKESVSPSADGGPAPTPDPTASGSDPASTDPTTSETLGSTDSPSLDPTSAAPTGALSLYLSELDVTARKSAGYDAANPQIMGTTYAHSASLDEPDCLRKVSDSWVQWAVPGDYRRLEATVGFSDSNKAQLLSATLKVTVNNVVKWTGTVKTGDKPLKMAADVSGGQLRIAATFVNHQDDCSGSDQLLLGDAQLTG